MVGPISLIQRFPDPNSFPAYHRQPPKKGSFHQKKNEEEARLALRGFFRTLSIHGKISGQDRSTPTNTNLYKPSLIINSATLKKMYFLKYWCAGFQHEVRFNERESETIRLQNDMPYMHYCTSWLNFHAVSPMALTPSLPPTIHQRLVIEHFCPVGQLIV